MKSGIYKILNKITEKFYIGSAVNFMARWTQHKSKLRLGLHPNKYLQASWNLHGADAFEFIIIEACDRDIIPVKEQFWLDELKPYDRNIGYNLYKIAGSPLGTKWTEDRKEAARIRMTGFKHTEEDKAKMKIIQNNRPKEHGEKISAGKMGHKQSEETKAKIKAANTHLYDSAFRAKQKASVSKLDKWPHGSVCKCRECLDKKNEQNRRYRKNAKEALSVQSI